MATKDPEVLLEEAKQALKAAQEPVQVDPAEAEADKLEKSAADVRRIAKSKGKPNPETSDAPADDDADDEDDEGEDDEDQDDQGDGKGKMQKSASLLADLGVSDADDILQDTTAAPEALMLLIGAMDRQFAGLRKSFSAITRENKALRQDLTQQGRLIKSMAELQSDAALAQARLIKSGAGTAARPTPAGVMQTPYQPAQQPQRLQKSAVGEKLHEAIADGKIEEQRGGVLLQLLGHPDGGPVVVLNEMTQSEKTAAGM